MEERVREFLLCADSMGVGTWNQALKRNLGSKRRAKRTTFQYPRGCHMEEVVVWGRSRGQGRRAVTEQTQALHRGSSSQGLLPWRLHGPGTRKPRDHECSVLLSGCSCSDADRPLGNGMSGSTLKRNLSSARTLSLLDATDKRFGWDLG